jgi:ureidoacrylate peracid hydrolase
MTKTPAFLVPKETVLLVIDLQKGFCHPESGMGRANGVGPQRRILPRVARLVAECRARGVAVAWTKQVHFPEDVTRARRRTASHAQKQGFLPCLRGTWETDFDDGIAASVRPEDHVIEKHRASPFLDTTLPTKLRMLGTRALIIAGCNTEYCVESTVRDAYARDFELFVPSDCVAGIRPDFHRDSLKKFAAYFAVVAPSAALDAAFVPSR